MSVRRRKTRPNGEIAAPGPDCQNAVLVLQGPENRRFRRRFRRDQRQFSGRSRTAHTHRRRHPEGEQRRRENHRFILQFGTAGTAQQQGILAGHEQIADVELEGAQFRTIDQTVLTVLSTVEKSGA
ncbi:hypothetical protein SDC9_115158 [bioreactor metagenome]|uniref:Uncharacterized protein n=1 Tax=bioreactor metagenome TaxID=1076179 RepID=A0A645BSL6_9ZZZZ